MYSRSSLVLHEAGHALFGYAFGWPVQECSIGPGRPFTKTGVSFEFSKAPELESIWEIIDGDEERVSKVDKAVLAAAMVSENALQIYERSLLYLVGGDIVEYEKHDQYLRAVANRGTTDSDGSKIDCLDESWRATVGRVSIGGNLVFRAYDIHALAVAAASHLVAHLEKKGKVTGIDAIATLLTRDPPAFDRFCARLKKINLEKINDCYS